MWIYSLFILFNSSAKTINSVKARELHAKQILPRAYQRKSHGPVTPVIHYFMFTEKGGRTSTMAQKPRMARVKIE
jgi:hypothetical protein